MAFPGGGMPPGGLEGLLGGLGLGGPGALENIWENPMVTSSLHQFYRFKLPTQWISLPAYLNCLTA